MVRSLITLLALCLVLGTAMAVPVNFAREDALTQDSLTARGDYYPTHRYRDVDGATSISARGDTLEARSFWDKIKSGFSKVVNFVAPVAKIATKFIRDEDAAELATRSFADHELHFHHYRALPGASFTREDILEARSFWDKIKSGFSKVVNFVAPVAKIATKFIRDEGTELSTGYIRDHELHMHHYREIPAFDVVARWESDSDISSARQEGDDVEEFVRSLEDLD